MELSLHDLSARHDIRLLVVRTLLTYLELAGYLEAGTPVYSEYELRPLATFEEILGRFKGERRDFLSGIFQQAKKARIWSRLDLETAARALGAPRDQLVRALDYLAEQSLLEVRAAGLRHPYRGPGDRPPRPGAGPGRPRRLPDRLPRRAFRRAARASVRPLLLV
jgi:ATP-dependent DNA helicase RecQ